MNDKPFVFWKFHAIVSIILFLIIGSGLFVFYQLFPQTLVVMIAMNQSLNMIAWIYMIYALKLYSSEEIAETIAKKVEGYFLTEDD